MGTKHPFEKVVEKHGGTVLRVCRVLLASHDADDAWSETFLAAIRAYPGRRDYAQTIWVRLARRRVARDAVSAVT